MFRRLTPEDRQRLGAVASTRDFDKGAMLFSEGDGSEFLYTVITGRVKVFKTTARGTDVILELFGPGDRKALRVVPSTISMLVREEGPREHRGHSQPRCRRRWPL